MEENNNCIQTYLLSALIVSLLSNAEIDYQKAVRENDAQNNLYLIPPPLICIAQTP